MTPGSDRDRLERFIATVESRMEAHLAATGDRRDGFVSSDLDAVRSVLERVLDERLASGLRFCEWGSAMGGVTGVAALVGFDAVGIELQPPLLEGARSVAAEFGLDVSFAVGTFVPAGSTITGDADYTWWDNNAPDGYDELETDPEEFDVVFAYPWPGEESAIDELFQQTAGVGTVLITNHGSSGFRIARLVADRTLTVIGWW